MPGKPNPQHDPFEYVITRRCRYCGFPSARGDRYQHTSRCPWSAARFEEWRKERLREEWRKEGERAEAV